MVYFLKKKYTPYLCLIVGREKQMKAKKDTKKETINTSNILAGVSLLIIIFCFFLCFFEPSVKFNIKIKNNRKINLMRLICICLIFYKN